jgi:holliday junction DNA helicase RuvA
MTGAGNFPYWVVMIAHLKGRLDSLGIDHAVIDVGGVGYLRDWFRLLTGVQGVGARVALAILSALDASDLSRAIAAQDKAMVARANGVGPKLAERIVRELKDKIGAVAIGGATPMPVGSASADAISAMLNLGFRPAEASAAVAAAEEELGAGVGLDALVRLALRKAAK